MNSPTNLRSTQHEGKISDLTVISYKKLLYQDVVEVSKLLKACSELGAFYLDLRASGAQQYLAMVNGLNRVSREYFARPLTDKMKDTNQESDLLNLCGYLPQTLDKGNIEQKRSGLEEIRVPSNLCFLPGKDSRLRRPSGIASDWELFMQFVGESHSIARLILENLSNALGLEGVERFESQHQAGLSSTSTAILQYYPYDIDGLEHMNISNNMSSDVGSIAIRFMEGWEFQVGSPSDEKLEYIQITKGDFAMITIGDALQALSGSKLRSCPHRVVPWRVGDRADSKYATMFLLRPNSDVELI